MKKSKSLFMLFSTASFLLALVSSDFALSQDVISGKAIKKGMWKNVEVEYVQGQVCVILQHGKVAADIISSVGTFEGKMTRQFDKLGWGLVEFPDSLDILSVITELVKNPSILVAEPNLVDHIRYETNDQYYQDGHQWALKNTGQGPPAGTNDADIDANDAWNVTIGSSNVIIGILDSGIPMLNGSLSHSDLDDPNKILLGADLVNDGEGVRDLYGHGTHVAGIASAETNNSTGIAGVAGGCRVLVVQVSNSYGSISHASFRDGVIYAVDNGARVVNYSAGGSPSSTKEQGVSYANDNNVVLVASSGNENGAVSWPAAYSTSYPNTVAVGATDHNDQRASYSNYGASLNVVAPGGYGGSFDANDIYSTTPNYTFNLGSWYGISQNYGYMAGTSMAAPHVSGIAALMLSVNPSLTAAQVRNIIQQKADDKGTPGRDDYYGYGRVNAYTSVLAAVKPNLSVTRQTVGATYRPRLTWTSAASGVAAGYYVFRYLSEDPGSGWVNIATTSGSTTTYTDMEVVISSTQSQNQNTAQYKVQEFDS